MTDIRKIIDSLSRTGDAKVIVFGDYALDKYLYIDAERDEASAETGKPAWQVERKFLAAGVGGTVTNNLRALGAQVTCIGLVGDDGEGFELLRELKRAGASTERMVREPSLCTSTYVKPMRREGGGTYREANRLDFRNFTEAPKGARQKLMDNLKAALDDADAVLIVDQYYQRNTGAVTDDVREALSLMAQSRPDKIFYADSRAFMQEYRHMIVKCNNLELFSKFEGGEGDPENPEQIVAKGKRIRERNGKPVFVTRGGAGIAVFGDKVALVPAIPVKGQIDTCGAGDATNAGIVLGLTLGLTAEEAGLLAGCVSSITIRQIGATGTATVAGVRQVLADLLAREKEA